MRVILVLSLNLKQEYLKHFILVYVTRRTRAEEKLDFDYQNIMH